MRIGSGEAAPVAGGAAAVRAARLPLDGRRFFALLGTVSAAGPAALDIYLPALPMVAADLGASTSATELTISFYLVGIALGQLVFGHLSDVHGRRSPLLVGMLLFAGASLLCAVSSSLPELIAARFAEGLGGAAGMVIARAVVRDLFGMDASARYYSRLVLIYGLAPTVAPLVGSILLQVTDWHGIFVVLGGFGLFAAALLWWAFPETLPVERRRGGALAETFAAFGTLLHNRRFVGCALTLSAMMCALVCYLATATFVIQGRYGASVEMFAVLSGANALVMVLSNQVNAHLLHRFTPQNLVLVGMTLLLAAAAWLVVVAVAGLGLAELELGLAGLMSSWGFVQGNVTAIGLADHAAMAGSGSAVLGLTQFGVGALAAPLGGLAGSGSVWPLAIVIACAAAVTAASAYWLVLDSPPLFRASSRCSKGIHAHGSRD